MNVSSLLIAASSLGLGLSLLRVAYRTGMRHANGASNEWSAWVIPPAMLAANGDNVITLAVTTDGKPGNALESVRLVDLRAPK